MANIDFTFDPTKETADQYKQRTATAIAENNPGDPLNARLLAGAGVMSTPTMTTAPTSTAIPTTPTTSPDDQKLVSLGLTPEQIAQVNSPNGMDPASFQNLIGQVEQKLKTNNDLVTQRGYLIKHLYDSPLTSDQLSQLPPDIQQVVSSGNKDAIELQLRLLNDQISGRANTLTQSIQTLTTGYQTAVADAEKKRQDAISNVVTFANTYGSKAPDVLKALYGQSYMDQLKAQGIDINALTDTPTIAEQRYAAQYGVPTGSLDVTIPAGTIASKTNNPLNIKYSSLMAGFGASNSGIAGQDGGTFASFNSPQEGLDAAVKLLQSPIYNNLTVDQAMRQWSNNAYGAEVAPELDPKQNMSALSPDQMDQLVQDMAQRESGSTVSASPNMIQSIAQGIENGSQPPVLTGLYGKSAAVRAQLEKDGFDLTKATQDWNAITKWQNTVDSATFQRAIVAADSAKQYITNLRNLNDKWNETNPLAPLDYAHFQLALSGALGQENQNTAQQVSTQIADLQADMASVYRYGLSSTDSSLENASKTLSENWNNGRLTASLDVIEPNLQVRINSLKSPSNALSASGTPNMYVGAPTTGSTDTSSLDSIFKQYGLQ